jgi:hypothetical protein
MRLRINGLQRLKTEASAYRTVNAAHLCACLVCEYFGASQTTAVVQRPEDRRCNQPVTDLVQRYLAVTDSITHTQQEASPWDVIASHSEYETLLPFFEYLCVQGDAFKS